MMGYPKITYRKAPKGSPRPPSKHWDGPIDAIGFIAAVGFMLVVAVIFKRE